MPLGFGNYVCDYCEEHGDGYCGATSYEEEGVAKPEESDI